MPPIRCQARAVAFYGANVSAQIGPISVHAHGEAGVSEDELLVLLAVGAL